MTNSLIDFDKTFLETYDCVIGTDEAGRGSAAGAVFAAAVFIPDFSHEFIKELNDSKKISQIKRERLFELIKKHCIYSIQSSSVDEIEKINILNASLNAMKKAVSKIIAKLTDKKNIILIDGNKLIKNVDYNQQFIIKGDSKSATIAAASILAKVERDNYMKKLDLKFPKYHFADNKGYLTKEHLHALDKYGVCEIHRSKFLRNYFDKQNVQMTLL